MTARDRGHVEEIINHLKRVENDYNINLTSEMEWLRGLSKEQKVIIADEVVEYDNIDGGCQIIYWPSEEDGLRAGDKIQLIIIKK